MAVKRQTGCSEVPHLDLGAVGSNHSAAAVFLSEVRNVNGNCTT